MKANSVINSLRSFVTKHLLPLRIIAAVIAFAMTAGLLIFANALVGNPVSYLIVKSKAEKYVAENYADKGYILESVSYDFKFGHYNAEVVKPGSEDCWFRVGYDFGGKCSGDNYDYNVVGGSNTRWRLDMSYRELINSIVESPFYPYSSEPAWSTVAFGKLVFEGDDRYDFCIPNSEIVPDKLYDIQKLGDAAGHLTICVDTKDTTPENAAKILLNIRSLMEQGGAPFHDIDLRLMDESLPANDETYYAVSGLLRSEIYEEGLVDRVIECHQKAADRDK